jgi:K(+)-stimulated pyrophosphate-energized sodium pump
MNILIKLMSIISLVIAPTLAKIHHASIEKDRQLKMENLQLLEQKESGFHSVKKQNTFILANTNIINNKK